MWVAHLMTVGWATKEQVVEAGVECVERTEKDR